MYATGIQNPKSKNRPDPARLWGTPLDKFKNSEFQSKTEKINIETPNQAPKSQTPNLKVQNCTCNLYLARLRLFCCHQMARLNFNNNSNNHLVTVAIIVPTFLLFLCQPFNSASTGQWPTSINVFRAASLSLLCLLLLCLSASSPASSPCIPGLPPCHFLYLLSPSHSPPISACCLLSCPYLLPSSHPSSDPPSTLISTLLPSNLPYLCHSSGLLLQCTYIYNNNKIAFLNYLYNLSYDEMYEC